MIKMPRLFKPTLKTYDNRVNKNPLTDFFVRELANMDIKILSKIKNSNGKSLLNEIATLFDVSPKDTENLYTQIINTKNLSYKIQSNITYPLSNECKEILIALGLPNQYTEFNAQNFYHKLELANKRQEVLNIKNEYGKPLIDEFCKLTGYQFNKLLTVKNRQDIFNEIIKNQNLIPKLITKPLSKELKKLLKEGFGIDENYLELPIHREKIKKLRKRSSSLLTTSTSSSQSSNSFGEQVTYLSYPNNSSKSFERLSIKKASSIQTTANFISLYSEPSEGVPKVHYLQVQQKDISSLGQMAGKIIYTNLANYPTRATPANAFNRLPTLERPILDKSYTKHQIEYNLLNEMEKNYLLSHCAYNYNCPYVILKNKTSRTEYNIIQKLIKKPIPIENINDIPDLYIKNPYFIEKD